MVPVKRVPLRAFLLCQWSLMAAVTRTSQLWFFVCSSSSAVEKNLMPLIGGLPSGFIRRAATSDGISCAWQFSTHAACSNRAQLRRRPFMPLPTCSVSLPVSERPISAWSSPTASRSGLPVSRYIKAVDKTVTREGRVVGNGDQRLRKLNDR